MAGQSIERREILRVLAMAASASEFPGFCRWAFACEQAETVKPRPEPESYMPQFFTTHEYATVEKLSDMIIPSDGSPGALQAGVSEFIGFILVNNVQSSTDSVTA